MAPILLVCLARDELLEGHPDFLADRENVVRIELDALTPEETDAMLDGLGGAVLESDQRARIVEAAEGNPFFLEQLLALSLEGGGLGERGLPETIQALLAARLDRLGPGERAVLERGAVVGKEFTAEDVAVLLDPHAAPTADAHLRTLAARGFVRPDDGAFAFRHVLVQEAAYRATPKRLRAELHERYADRLDAVAADVADLDEFVGYHLEQAQRLLGELGESDRRTARLAQDGGRRLGDAGIRAWKRNDTYATVNLLRRAIALLPADERRHRELRCELGIALRATGDAAGAESMLAETMRDAREAGDRPVEMRARVEHAFIQVLHESGMPASVLLDATDGGDSRPRERRGRPRARPGVAARGLRPRRPQRPLRAAGRSRPSARWCTTGGPAGRRPHASASSRRPSTSARPRCRTRWRAASGSSRRRSWTGSGARTCSCSRAGSSRSSAASTRRGTSSPPRGRSTRSSDTVRRSRPTPRACSRDVELLAGEAGRAELMLREVCAELERARDFGHLASRAGDLAEALYAQGLLDDADAWTRIAETHAAVDDFGAQVRWRLVRAKVAARRGELETAEKLAREAVELSEASDGLNRLAKVQRDVAEVAELAGRTAEAAAALSRALELYEQKGNLVGAAQVRRLQTDLLPA